MKSLVVKGILTQLNDNGTELELGTNQFKAECEYIDKKTITIKSVKVTIDKDTFKTKMGGTLSNSYYYFQRVDNKWDMYGGAENVDLSEYGITLEKNVSNLNLSATIGRRDGARDGWIGGINVKYVF
jgi:hypothetical protein